MNTSTETEPASGTVKPIVVVGLNGLGEFCATANAEVSPVCAVLGGVLGNEVIKAISGRGEPANNILLFDGLEGGCKAFTIKKSL